MTPLATIESVPYRRIDDPEKLRGLLEAVFMIEADIELASLLRHIVEEASALVGARYGALGVLNQSRTGLDEFVTTGLSASEELLIGARPVGRGVLGTLISEPEPLRLADLRSHPDSYGVPPNHPPMTSFLGVPVRLRDEVYGNLYLTEKRGANEFTEEDQYLAEALAIAAGIAIENHRLHERVRVMSLIDDRDRIARDLHDRVIQRVYAVGMGLQEATRSSDLQQVLRRVDKSVDDLDATINDIRTSIYELGDDTMLGGLRHGVLELASELAPLLGARAEVRFLGPIDSTVSQRTADHVLAVVREGLTNAGKHAGATRYAVLVKAKDDLTLEVADDGVGFDVDHVTSGLGLANLRHRAQKLGGTFNVSSSPEGTRLIWRVPLQSSSATSTGARP